MTELSFGDPNRKVLVTENYVCSLTRDSQVSIEHYLNRKNMNAIYEVSDVYGSDYYLVAFKSFGNLESQKISQNEYFKLRSILVKNDK